MFRDWQQGRAQGELFAREEGDPRPLQILQRSGEHSSEGVAPLGIMGESLEELRTSQHYGIVGFEGGSGPKFMGVGES